MRRELQLPILKTRQGEESPSSPAEKSTLSHTFDRVAAYLQKLDRLIPQDTTHLETGPGYAELTSRRPGGMAR